MGAVSEARSLACRPRPSLLVRGARVRISGSAEEVPAVVPDLGAGDHAVAVVVERDVGAVGAEELEAALLEEVEGRDVVVQGGRVELETADVHVAVDDGDRKSTRLNS